ncbi:hypothetical protein [Undibacterium curvum]|uniref:Lipoprotein n=1 Tax=Undibacterium curvum TaxID=2762294 RepID=A0ABR7A0L6_9BURK|nr:hypothetical protein [Undibacterium curvum]MBC3930399.1 hypothetical protein [Undibacterium curvum]
MTFTCRKPLLLVAVATLLSSCTSTPALNEPDEASLGRSKFSPVEVCRISGKDEYLARLVCESGDRIEIGQRGNVGPRTEMKSNATQDEVREMIRRNLQYSSPAAGVPDYHIVDVYPVKCGATVRFVYLDMYHCDKPSPQNAPRGFKLLPTQR